MDIVPVAARRRTPRRSGLSGDAEAKRRSQATKSFNPPAIPTTESPHHAHTSAAGTTRAASAAENPPWNLIVPVLVKLPALFPRGGGSALVRLFGISIQNLIKFTSDEILEQFTHNGPLGACRLAQLRSYTRS